MGLMDEVGSAIGVSIPVPRLRLVKDEESPQSASEARNARPEALSAFIGQEAAVFNLSAECAAAEMDGRLPGHVLLEGPPGLGKTSLARCVADRLGCRFVELPGTSLGKVNDAASALAKIGEPRDGPCVVFVDEIQIICKKAQVLLLSALEDGHFTPSGAERVDLAPFCLIAASTNPGKLDKPLLDRFGVREALSFYPEETLKAILMRYAESQGLMLEEDAAELVAMVGRGTPRVANGLLRRISVFAKVAGRDSISAEVVEESLEQLGVDEFGMEEKDRKILRALFGQSSPIGIESLAALVESDAESVKSREGYLIRIGMLRRSGRGRIASKDAYRALGEPVPVYVPLF